MSLIGQVNVAGRTLGEVQSEITQRYAEKYLVNPRVNIDVLNYRPFFILGEVKNPGGYPYVAGMTVVNAIALAGGYTPRGSKRGITIKRTNIKDGKEQSATEDGPVLPGDVIRVPERLF
jgi:protein involved in polysaccharide export with SLBB domain